jgi:hypothetical protein
MAVSHPLELAWEGPKDAFEVWAADEGIEMDGLRIELDIEAEER